MTHPEPYCYGGASDHDTQAHGNRRHSSKPHSYAVHRPILAQTEASGATNWWHSGQFFKSTRQVNRPSSNFIVWFVYISHLKYIYDIHSDMHTHSIWLSKHNNENILVFVYICIYIYNQSCMLILRLCYRRSRRLRLCADAPAYTNQSQTLTLTLSHK